MPNHSDNLIRSKHLERYGVAPDRIARAPGRINLIGEHIDYSCGIVLPLAIDRHARVGISRSTEADRVRIQALDLGEAYESSIESFVTEPPSPSHWVNYVLGPLVTLDDGIARYGLDITFTSDVPMGAGLSSSAALEVATARAANELLGLNKSPIEIARCCQQAEHRFAGVPCGLMDQAAAALAPGGCLLAFDCLHETGRIIQSPDDLGLIAIDSGVRHALGDSAYRDRRLAAEQAAESMGCSTLRDVLDQSRSAGLDQLPIAQREAAQHGLSEMHRVHDAIEALESGDLDRVGQLLNQSHASLRDTLRVSCDEVDAIVDIAQRHERVLGARMTGGGFGGCVIALVHRSHTQRVANELMRTCPPGIDTSIVLIDASGTDPSSN